MIFEVFQILWRPGLKAVHANNLVTFCQEEIDEVGAQEPRGLEIVSAALIAIVRSCLLR